jgi:ring-1,2-phenylacetyl-CoA epoxidase subunit PaaC
MDLKHALFKYLVRLGDNALVLGQRLIEIVADGPELEEELANANFSLDYLGQARLFYSYAGEIEAAGRTEDDFAFLRSDREFENVLLVEQPNGHFGDVIVRSALFDAFYLLQLEALSACSDQRLVEIAVKAAKEIRYHLRYGSQWLVRLGDGTEESHPICGSLPASCLPATTSTRRSAPSLPVPISRHCRRHGPPTSRRVCRSRSRGIADDMGHQYRGNR